MEFVLRSEVFERAPRLARFFRYICERYFEGNSDQIKEYSIALGALGRPADFDPKKDSIVRVEAHRLRKRLEAYYRGPGADHPIQIALPCGQYRPEFRSLEREPVDTLTKKVGTTAARPQAEPYGSTLGLVEISNLETADLHIVRPDAKRPIGWQSIRVILAMLTLASAFLLWLHLQKKASASDERVVEASNSIAPQPKGTDLRILAGYRGPVYMDRQGHAWGSDAFFQGGTAKPISADHFIEGQPDPHLLRSTRIGDFRYDIPLRPGAYELHLYFAETEYGPGNRLEGGDSTRTFQVGINGQSVLTALDPLAEAGAPNRLLERVFKDIHPAPGGKLHLTFNSVSASAMLSGIEILPSQPGRIHPIRIVTQSNPVTDSDGRVWAADEYFCGGATVSRDNVLLNPEERSLYQGERYGNFSYRIPLAPGKYRLTLYFAEQWFGTEAAGMASPDHRAFDIFANRDTLLKNFTPAAETGGANRSVEKSFDNITPNAQGMLLLEFVPVRNYAEINAIELVETH